MIWYNLAVLYDQHGARELCQQVTNQIGHVATHYTGPLDRDCALVFERMSEVAASSGNVDFMLTLLAQAHRYWYGNPDIDAQKRTQWLGRYLKSLVTAGRDAEAVATETAKAAAEVGEHQLRVDALFVVFRHQKARGDRAAARQSLEVAVDALTAAGESDSEQAAVVYQNMAALQLEEPPGPGDARAAQRMDTALQILTKRGLARGYDFAACLRERSLLASRLGDWRTAAVHLERAAAVADITPDEVNEALSRAGDAWYRLGAYDDASRCYLSSIRRRAGRADA